MKIYLLLGSDGYYPSHDNTLRVFKNELRAVRFCDKLEEAPASEYDDWAQNARQRHSWIPKYRFDYYTVEEYDVDTTLPSCDAEGAEP